MFCTECGAKIDDDARFCTECGAKVEESISASQEQATPTGSDDMGASSDPAPIAETASETQAFEAAATEPLSAHEPPTERIPIPMETAVMPTLADTGSDSETTGASTASSTASAANPIMATKPAASAAGASQDKQGPNKTLIMGICIGVAVAAVIALICVLAFGTQGAKDEPASTQQPSAESSAESSAEEAAPVQVTVPDLSGTTNLDAQAILLSYGLQVGTITEKNSDTVYKGMVISQSIPADTKVDEGQAVDLVISAGSAMHTYVVIDGSYTWGEAQAYCTQNGGMLACVNNADEWNQVLAAANASGRKVLWLGGFAFNGSYRWVDDTPVTYSAWGPGEPNNDGGNEDKIAMLNAGGTWGWYDVPEDVSDVYSADKCGFVMELP